MKIILLAAALAACAAVPPDPATQPATDEGSCNAEAAGALVGRAAAAELGAEALRLSGAARLRWIRPGDAVTMDYNTDRLNIHLDARDRVEHFACG